MSFSSTRSSVAAPFLRVAPTGFGAAAGWACWLRRCWRSTAGARSRRSGCWPAAGSPAGDLPQRRTRCHAARRGRPSAGFGLSGAAFACGASVDGSSARLLRVRSFRGAVLGSLLFRDGGEWALLPAVLCFRDRLPNFPRSPACYRPRTATAPSGLRLCGSQRKPRCYLLFDSVYLSLWQPPHTEVPETRATLSARDPASIQPRRASSRTTASSRVSLFSK